MGKVLFIGNGINQIEGEGASWPDLLNVLAIWKGGQVPEPSNYKPLPLYLEEIALIDGRDYENELREANLHVHRIFKGIEPKERINQFYLPSTSAANAIGWDKKLKDWSVILGYLK